MTVTQDIPKMIYPGTGTAHIVICSSFPAWPEPILFAHPATIACDPRFSTTTKRLKMMQLLTLFDSYVYDCASAGIWVIHIEVANLGARWSRFLTVTLMMV